MIPGSNCSTAPTVCSEIKIERSLISSSHFLRSNQSPQLLPHQFSEHISVITTRISPFSPWNQEQHITKLTLLLLDEASFPRHDHHKIKAATNLARFFFVKSVIPTDSNSQVTKRYNTSVPIVSASELQPGRYPNFHAIETTSKTFGTTPSKTRQCQIFKILILFLISNSNQLSPSKHVIGDSSSNT
jgi:hypothetical protein